MGSEDSGVHRLVDSKIGVLRTEFQNRMEGLYKIMKDDVDHIRSDIKTAEHGILDKLEKLKDANQADAKQSAVDNAARDSTLAMMNKGAGAIVTVLIGAALYLITRLLENLS